MNRNSVMNVGVEAGRFADDRFGDREHRLHVVERGRPLVGLTDFLNPDPFAMPEALQRIVIIDGLAGLALIATRIDRRVDQGERGTGNPSSGAAR